MIRPLRQIHRASAIVLSVTLPIVFVAAIALRSPTPLVAARSGRVNSTESAFKTLVWEKSDLWTKPVIKTRLFSDEPASKPSRLAVQLIPDQSLTRPDVLIYWMPSVAGPLDQVPDDAVLLGSIASHPVMPLPVSPGKTLGALILYSLADHEVLAVSKSIPRTLP